MYRGGRSRFEIAPSGIVARKRRRCWLTTSSLSIAASKAVFTEGTTRSAFGEPISVGTTGAIQANMSAQFKGAGNGIFTLGQDPALTNYAGLWTTNGTPSGTNYNFLADSTGADGNLYFNGPGGLLFQIAGVTQLQFAVDRAKFTGTTPAAPGTCGTSPTIRAGSTNANGMITTGSTATTSCILTFTTTYAAAPFCTATPEGAANSGLFTVTTTTTLTFNYTSATSLKINYHCFGN